MCGEKSERNQLCVSDDDLKRTAITKSQVKHWLPPVMYMCQWCYAWHPNSTTLGNIVVFRHNINTVLYFE